MTPDVRLSALRRDGFCLRVRAGVGVSCYALTRVNALMCPLLVAEGGVPKPPGCVVTNHARRRRIPLRLWLVSGDALDERDTTTIGARNAKSTLRRMLFIALVTARCA
jgi:hypothetical protein